MIRFRFFNLKLLFVLLTGCLIQCKQDEIIYENPQSLELTEFTFIPKIPSAKEKTSLVFYGCRYYETTSVNLEQQRINITKHFNSQLKWPCVLQYDTIHLGTLSQGEYMVTMQIIDRNPFVTDSLFHTETKILKVNI